MILVSVRKQACASHAGWNDNGSLELTPVSSGKAIYFSHDSVELTPVSSGKAMHFSHGSPDLTGRLCQEEVH